MKLLLSIFAIIALIFAIAFSAILYRAYQLRKIVEEPEEAVEEVVVVPTKKAQESSSTPAQENKESKHQSSRPPEKADSTVAKKLKTLDGFN